MQTISAYPNHFPKTISTRVSGLGTITAKVPASTSPEIMLAVKTMVRVLLSRLIINIASFERLLVYWVDEGLVPCFRRHAHLFPSSRLKCYALKCFLCHA